MKRIKTRGKTDLVLVSKWIIPSLSLSIPLSIPLCIELCPYAHIQYANTCFMSPSLSTLSHSEIILFSPHISSFIKNYYNTHKSYSFTHQIYIIWIWIKSNQMDVSLNHNWMCVMWIFNANSVNTFTNICQSYFFFLFLVSNKPSCHFVWTRTEATVPWHVSNVRGLILINLIWSHTVTYTCCRLVIAVVVAASVITVSYILFRLKNEGRCVDIKNGDEFNTSFIRSERSCRDHGYQWVYEPFSIESLYPGNFWRRRTYNYDHYNIPPPPQYNNNDGNNNYYQ